MKEFKFRETEADKCIYIGTVRDCVVYLALFVDDGLIAAKESKVIEIVIKHLRCAFNVTIGDASMFVGMQIERRREEKSLSIHQSAYVKRIVEKFGMGNAKSVGVPLDPHGVLYPVNESEEIERKVPYREAVGSLMFLAVVSRPDLAYAVNSVSKFLNNHGESHWRAVKRIFAYLKGTSGYGIKYQRSETASDLVGFSDADYAGDLETRRSTTGYIFQLAGGPITWASQRQKLVTLSTTESEYVAASAASREAIWLRKLLSDIGYLSRETTTIFVDNQSAIKLVKNPEFHKRTKHIDIRYHYIREKVEAKDIMIKYVPSEQQKADMFTKALPKERFRMLCESMNVENVSE